MTGHELLEAIGDMDIRFLRNEPSMPVKKQRRYTWLAIAAGLLVIAGGIYAVARFARPGGKETIVMTTVTNTTTNTTSTETTPDISKETSLDVRESNEQGVYIPEIALPEEGIKAGYSMSDMIGLVVYKGGIYTQARHYDGEDLEKVSGLIGEHLGTAKGNLDEWSSQDEYATEFASNMGGEVYTVKGYDPGFRICVCVYENDEILRMVMFMERMNNITISTGEDIFETRLHICGNVRSVQKQSHDDWDNGRGDFIAVTISEDVWDAFWKSTIEAPVFDTWSDVNLSLIHI